MKPLTWQETQARLKVDFKRLREHLPLDEQSHTWSIFLSPSYCCVLLYRISHYLHTKGNRLLARLLWQINFFFTGADLNPISNIGEGLVILQPFSVIIIGRSGKNLTVEGMAGFGGGLSMRDIGAGPGFAWVGNDVYLGRGATILGPQKIGNNVTIGNNCTVVKDIPDNATLSPIENRMMKNKQ